MALSAMTFGQFIKERRMQLGYKPSEVATKGGFNQSSLHAWESSTNLPAAGNLIKLSKALELSSEDLKTFNLSPIESGKTKPIQMVLGKIRVAKRSAETTMTGESQFEINMKFRLIDALNRCEEIMTNIAFLDDAF